MQWWNPLSASWSFNFLICKMGTSGPRFLDCCEAPVRFCTHCVPSERPDSSPSSWSTRPMGFSSPCNLISQLLSSSHTGLYFLNTLGLFWPQDLCVCCTFCQELCPYLLSRVASSNHFSSCLKCHPLREAFLSMTHHLISLIVF